MKHDKTFRTDRLYHMFLKPNRIELDQLPFLITRLYEAGFIDLIKRDDFERYIPNPKLTSLEHAKELFSIIERLKN